MLGAARTRAYAKINLTLEVLGRRDDGYHKIVSLMQTVSLHDVVEVRPGKGVEVAVIEGNAPEGDANLAAQLLDAAGVADVRVEISKRIPEAGGLGGGSSDAVAALRAAWSLADRTSSASQLAREAAKVGSDTPFFAYGGTCLVEGRGEAVTALPDMEMLYLVLLLPPWKVERKTESLFALLRPEHWDDGGATEAALRQARPHSRFEASLVYNTFEKVADSALPDLPALRAEAERRSGKRFLLSGAGPALFALTGSMEEARILAAELSDLCRAEAAHSIGVADATRVELT
jgi:4-diphosphocytidyl-2-C-methyl-D-erythritol kinase